MAHEASRYVFHSVWQIAAECARVYETLQDVAGYPAWWPEVREAHQFDPAHGELRCRSVLPYDLVFRLERQVQDPSAGVLRARLSGDLVGTSEWRVRPDADGGTLAEFEEDVTVGKAGVRAAGRFARPVFVYNHDRMMRSGELGLRRYLDSGA